MEFGGVVYLAHALAATTGDRLEQYRETDLVGFFQQ